MSGIAEAARTIRTNLLFMAPDRPFRRLLVTSAGPSEARPPSPAVSPSPWRRRGQRVVIIDCDLRKPRLHRIFGKDSKVGVTTALLEESIDNAILSTEVPNLSRHPRRPHPAEPGGDPAKRALPGLPVTQVQGRFDRVILDSPPIVPVTDGARCSPRSSTASLVVRAFKTSKDLARHALRALLDVGANIAGTVLNAVNLDKGEYKYSQYYYYRRDGYCARTPPAHLRPRLHHAVRAAGSAAGSVASGPKPRAGRAGRVTMDDPAVVDAIPSSGPDGERVHVVMRPQSSGKLRVREAPSPRPRRCPGLP